MASKGKHHKGKILVLTSTFPRWENDSVSSFVYDISLGLHNDGWEVFVLAPHDKGANPQEVLNGIHVTRFRYLWPERLETLFYRGGAMVSLRKSKLKWCMLPMAVISQLIYTLYLVYKIRPQLIHAHWLIPQGAVAVLIGKLFRLPTITTIHGTDIFALKQPILTFLKKTIVQLSDCVTVNSSATKKAADELVNGKAVCIPIGSNMRVTNSDLSLIPTKEKVFRIVFIGRLIEEKGVLDLIDALSSFFKVVPNAECIIIGDGPLNLKIKEEIINLGIVNQVSCLGWLSQDKVKEVLLQANVCVGPSKKSSSGGVEAQGVVFIEALLCCTPVIATRSGGIPDIIKDEETGLLVEENSPKEIFEALVRIYKNPILVEKIKKQGYELANQEFQLETTVSRFSSIFSGLI